MAAAWADVQGVVLHHTVTPTPTDHAGCKSQVAGITSYHKGQGYHDDNGAPAIAYNFVVCPHGKVVGGRGLASTNDANGCNEENRRWVAVALLGTNPGLTPEADARVRALIAEVESTFGSGKVSAHKDIWCASTSCPGPKLIRWIEEYQMAQFTEAEAEVLKDLAKAMLSLKVGGGAVARAGRDKHTHTGDAAPGAHTHEAKVTLA